MYEENSNILISCVRIIIIIRIIERTRRNRRKLIIRIKYIIRVYSFSWIILYKIKIYIIRYFYIKWTVITLPAFPKCPVRPRANSLRPVGIPFRHHLRHPPSSCPDRPRRLCNPSICGMVAKCHRPPWNAANGKRTRAPVRSNSNLDPTV